MIFEVEQKFPVDDLAAIESRLKELDAHFAAAIQQTDQYYAHPSRDFGVTDEALRIRAVNDECVITYKGPRIDTETKTRKELEIPLAENTETAIAQLLEVLGFVPVMRVEKVRVPVTLQYDDTTVAVALDRVQDLGSFVELEVVVATESEISAAKAVIGQLAARFGLGNFERRSYLELLLGR